MKQIPLTQNQFALVDDDMFDAINQYKWCATYDPTMEKFYAVRGEKRNRRVKQYRMHHAVIGKPPKGFVIDHINGEPLDNRRDNLRIVSIRVNQHNQWKHRAGHLAGAYYKPKSGRWEAHALLAGKKTYLGMFGTALEAHQRYMAVVSAL